MPNKHEHICSSSRRTKASRFCFLYSVPIKLETVNKAEESVKVDMPFLFGGIITQSNDFGKQFGNMHESHICSFDPAICLLRLFPGDMIK